jgi:Xaa-Pro aminopeptidase
VRDVQSAAVDAVRPGVSKGHIDAVARDKIAAAALSDFLHLTGHHAGFRYPDPGFAIAPGMSAKLEPGMVITIDREYM